MVQGTKSLSPGEALRLQKAMQRQTHAYSALAQSLMRGEIVGDDVQRLHDAIGASAGDADKLNAVDTELALRHFLAINQRMSMDVIRNIR